MSRCVADFRQGSSTGQSVADERMPAVMDGKRGKALAAENLARRPKSFPQSMARKSHRLTIGLQRRDEGILGCGPAYQSLRLPCSYILKCPSIPPQRHGAR